jgi:hypothetical protein
MRSGWAAATAASKIARSKGVCRSSDHRLALRGPRHDMIGRSIKGPPQGYCGGRKCCRMSLC